MTAASEPIAIVGLACEYPDAPSPERLWENVLACRRAFRRLPPERLRLEDYADDIYSTEAAVLEGYRFDRVAFKVSGPSFRAADPTHRLALDVAHRALADAGFADGCGLPRDDTTVVLGNTLTGEFSRAGLMRLRWPYVRRVVDGVLTAEGVAAERRLALLASIEREYKALCSRSWPERTCRVARFCRAEGAVCGASGRRRSWSSRGRCWVMIGNG